MEKGQRERVKAVTKLSATSDAIKGTQPKILTKTFQILNKYEKGVALISEIL